MKQINKLNSTGTVQIKARGEVAHGIEDDSISDVSMKREKFRDTQISKTKGSLDPW